ncbi:MAG: hypothetical protein ACI8ZN_000539 [Bacteroidia bacterium]
MQGNVYPNPNNGTFAIVLPEVDLKQVTIEIYDLMGHLVYQTNEIGNSKVEVKVGDLRSGTYIVHFKTNSLSEAKRVVVLHSLILWYHDLENVTR